MRSADVSLDAVRPLVRRSHASFFCHAIGPVGLAVTTNLNINFLSKAPAGADLVAEAKLLKLGKRLAVGEVTLYSTAAAEPVAHVTATYSIPPKRN